MQQKILNNRYELEQKLGEGGMARVYRGRDLRLNRPVAIKVLHSQYASDTGFLQRFQHEAQAVANLRHPNIVDVYDVGQDGDIHYIVMEYVPGSDLKALILRQAPLPIEQAVTIAEAVARGLEAAHRLGMIHRDIKPQNIIVGDGSVVKITDFGIAKSKMSTAMTETGVTFGTADYISPEQARGLPATPQSDIYALGVTLYEMLTGRLPFTGDSSVVVAMQHVNTEPPPLRMYNPRVPPQLEGIVLRAISKEPADRPASAREFAQQLLTYRNSGEQETVIRPAPRPAQPVQRTPSSTTAPRPVLPPPRPAVAEARPNTSSGNFGGFLLGLLLLGGVLGLVYLFAIGAFDGLFSLANGAINRPTALPAATTTSTSTLPQVPVPDVVGKTEAEARTQVQGAGLGVFVAEPRHSDTITAGLVMEQFPPAQMPVTQAASSVVTLTLSLGPELIDVPDVQRTRAADARNLLIAAGFQVQVQEEPSTLSEGFVLRQDPVNVKLPRGQTVTIVVSIGNKVVVPEITGLSEADARARIEAAGLFVSFVDQQGCDKLGDLCNRFGPGLIVSSDPRPGTRVERGSGVTLGQRKP